MLSSSHLPEDFPTRRTAVRHLLGTVPVSVPTMWLAVVVILLPVRQQHGLLGWGLLLAVLALVSGGWRLWARHLALRQGLETAEAVDWAWRQLVNNARFASLLWPIATLSLYPHLDIEQRSLHAIVIAGSAALTCFYMALTGRQAELLIASMLLPMLWVSAVPDSTRWIPLAIMVVMYWLALHRLAGQMRTVILSAIRHGHDADQANLALRDALARANAAQASQARFLAVMSHEIRTPLHGVLGTLQLLLQDTASSRRNELLAVAQRSGQGLLAVLNDALDFSRLEADQLRLRPSANSPADLLREVHALFAASARAKQLDLRLDLADGLPAAVLVDRQRLHQVLSNLLANAVKFTPGGHVRLGLSVLARDGQSVTLRWEVEDSGVGIAPDQPPRLFAPFEQLDHGPDRQYAGSGLGLTIAQGLVQRMGGQLELCSALGRGSCFFFSLQLPLAASAPAQDALAQAASGAGLHGTVLVAEDNPTNLLILSQLLKHWGLAVREAMDGEQALTAMAQGDVQLVLMDGQMPVLDGYSATRRWRAREAAQGLARLPIIAVTANTQPSDRDQALAAGMDELLAKPFQAHDLAVLLARWLPSRGANP